MSTIFNNLDPDLRTPLSRNDGWEPTDKYDNHKINMIKDTISSGGIGYYKLGTSIPTPFARIFMFRNAFNRLTDMDDQTSIYGKLVSECLDFLEFLFHFGEEVEVKKWSFTTDIALLRGGNSQSHGAANNPGTPPGDIWGPDTPGSAAPANTMVNGHTLLADCLLNMRDELGLPDATGNIVPVDNIYLLYYKGVLMGGTSPFTLVFTSPNWQRNKNCGTVRGGAQNVLFPNYQEEDVKATPLHHRDTRFIQFILTYTRAYGTGAQSMPLMNYILKDLPYIGQMYPQIGTVYNNTLLPMAPADVQQHFNSQYAFVEDNRTPIYAHNAGGLMLPLAYKKNVISPNASSDYTISSPKGAFDITDSQNAVHRIEKVMILSKGGLTAVGGQEALYIGGSPWQANYAVGPEIASVDLWNRTLPGLGNYHRPFITEYDLFEEYILRVPYVLNDDKFYTYVNQNWNYLLPLKKMFFNFFDKDYLEDPNHFSIKEENGEVTCTLKIPVTFNPQNAGVQQYLKIERIYTKDKVKELQGATFFAMAVFPSYRVMDNDSLNDYTLMAANGNVEVKMEFYTQKDVQKPLQVNCLARPDEIKSQFCRVHTAFDFIQICPALPDMGAPVHALIIPKFSNAYLNSTGQSDWKFSIDFGTSNTYIASTKSLVPETFTINNDEIQVMYLDKIDPSLAFDSEEYKLSIGNTYVPQFHAAADRAFAPMIIGNGGIAKYPLQTSTCESTNYNEVLDVHGGEIDPREPLFSKIAIGYNMNHEIFSKNYQYRTDLKWAAERLDGNERMLAKMRIKLYCQQIAWMLKNKVALSSSSSAPESPNFTVYYTYPCSMGDDAIGELHDNWVSAFGPDVTVHGMTESEAPYYFLAKKGQITGGKNFLNIDIGGGTTDMFYVIQENNQQKSYYTSMRFAGNDLWGDGVNQTAYLSNGFYKYVKANMPQMKSDIQRLEEMVFGNPKNTMTSADIMAYLFGHDANGLVPMLIQSKSRTFYPLLLVHYGAIIYHVAMILKDKNWEIPKNINLTGMGSKYVHIIANETSMTRLTGMLLNRFTGQEVPNGFKLTFSQNNAKEITAQGALLRDFGAGRSTLIGDPVPFQVYGFSRTETGRIQYETAAKDEVRQQILQQYDEFIKVFLEDKEIQDELMANFHKAEISDWLINGLRDKADESYLAIINNTPNLRDFVSETLFFWPLKNAIYELSKEAIAEDA